MSWFDTAGFANLAKSALSSAQKRIDQALDIQGDPGPSFALPADTDAFFLSFGLADGSSPKKSGAEKQTEVPLKPAESKSSSSSLSTWTSGWGSFLDDTPSVSSTTPAAEVPTTIAPKSVSSPILPAISAEDKDTPVISQPLKSYGDDTAPSSDASSAPATEKSDDDTPLVVDLPIYPSLDQSVESDGSTETLLGASSSPDDALVSGSATPDRAEKDSSPPGWKTPSCESGQDVVIVRAPEHSNSAREFPSKKVSVEKPTPREGDSSTVDCTELETLAATPRWDIAEVPANCGSDLGTEVGTADGEFSIGARPVREAVPAEGASPASSQASCEAIDEEKAPQEFLVDSKADEPPSTGDAKDIPENLEPSKDAEPGHVRKSSSESPPKEDCDARSIGSVHSAETTSSASFVRISPDETEESHKSHSPSYDEAETGTSSDIEIISTPNGDSNSDRFSAISSSAQLWTSTRHEEKRATSPALSGGSGDKLTCSEATHCGIELSEVEKLRGRVTELQEVLDARERKVFLLSKEVVQLNETNAALQNSLRKLDEMRARETQDTSSLTQEFSQRLAKLETRLTDTARERDILKAKLDAVQQESATKVSALQMEQVIREKDEQIKELMSEGEKLSKHQLQQSTVIKKLRSKEKDMEGTIKSYKDKLEDQSKELERLRKSLSAKDEQEKKHIDTIRQLTSTNQKQDRDIQSLKESLSDATENVETTLVKLNSAYSEIAVLRQANSECESRAEEATLSAKMAAGEELRRALEETRATALTERASLLQRIEELQVALTMAEQRGEHREDVLRASVTQLQQQLQDAESRNQEISQHISSATRPLLRQIENLQATFSVQSASWEKIEKSLTDRLSEAQTQATLLSERERALQEKCSDLQARLTGLEAQNTTLRNDKHSLSADIDVLRERLRDAEDFKRRENNFEVVKSRLEQSLKSLRSEKEEATCKVIALQEELESERHKNLLLQDQLQEKRDDASPLPSPTTSQYSSVSDTFNANVGTELGSALPYNVAPSRTTSLYESLRAAGGTTLLESLQSQLKMKEGEVGHLQAEITQLERSRSSLSRELMSLSEKLETMEKEVQELRGISQQHNELNQRYNTLLQMYGEKVEEAEELRLDLEDVKSMYKAQINELIAKQ
ncbi:TATA element modulatory factor-like isoform X2 [Ornithodoros turicata]|uniref:TATA element modulatory factor-like isoform X2 n=1 Tax=Ornithodoros turicata TaxID=34597 RepID=UPI003138CD1C